MPSSAFKVLAPHKNPEPLALPLSATKLKFKFTSSFTLMICYRDHVGSCSENSVNPQSGVWHETQVPEHKGTPRSRATGYNEEIKNGLTWEVLVILPYSCLQLSLMPTLSMLVLYFLDVDPRRQRNKTGTDKGQDFSHESDRPTPERESHPTQKHCLTNN